MGLDQILCCDSNRRKKELSDMLLANGVACITFGAEVGLHFDDTVPPSTKFKDIGVEVALLASCKGLLCTRSNISFMVASMANESFQVYIL